MNQRFRATDQTGSLAGSIGRNWLVLELPDGDFSQLADTAAPLASPRNAEQACGTDRPFADFATSRRPVHSPQTLSQRYSGHAAEASRGLSATPDHSGTSESDWQTPHYDFVERIACQVPWKPCPCLLSSS